MRKTIRFVISIGSAFYLASEVAVWSVCIDCTISVAGVAGFAVIGLATFFAVFVFWMWLFDELKEIKK